MADIQKGGDPSNFNYGEVLTPFAQKGQFFDYALGIYRDKARFWRLLTIWCLLASLLLGIWFVLIMLLPQNTIYTAQITKNGFVRSVGVLNDNYVIPRRVGQHFVHRYINSVFSIQANKAVREHHQAFVQSTSAKNVIQQFPHFLNKTGVDKNYPVRIHSIRETAPGVFSANWSGVKLSPKGNVIGEADYNGEFHIVIKDLENPEQVSYNPLGFYVSNVRISSIKEVNNGQR